MNVIDYLTSFEVKPKTGSGIHKHNQDKKRDSYALLSCAMEKPVTLKTVIKKTGLKQGYLGKKIRMLEDLGVVKCVGQTIGAQCRKPSYLWVWCGNEDI